MSFFDIFKSPEQKFENQIEKVFKNAVKNASKGSGGVPMLEGVLVFHAISVAYDTLRRDDNLRIASGMSTVEYGRLIQRVMDRIGRKEISNWDQMMRGRDDF